MVARTSGLTAYNVLFQTLADGGGSNSYSMYIAHSSSTNNYLNFASGERGLVVLGSAVYAAIEGNTTNCTYTITITYKLSNLSAMSYTVADGAIIRQIIATFNLSQPITDAYLSFGSINSGIRLNSLCVNYIGASTLQLVQINCYIKKMSDTFTFSMGYYGSQTRATVTPTLQTYTY